MGSKLQVTVEEVWNRPFPELQLQYFGRLMRRTGSLEKTLVLGKIEGST